MQFDKRRFVMGSQSLLRLMIAVIAVLAFFTAQEAASGTIHFQGILTDDGGGPIEGTHSIIFRIYNVESGGTALWTETIDVTCEGGLFSVMLGSTSPIDLSFAEQYWLSVQISGEEEMSPRHKLASVPYAMWSAASDSAMVAGFADTASSAGTANIAHEVDWDNITDMPAGFSDGVDDAGADIIHEHDDRYYTETELNSSGTINGGSNPVDWTKLKNVPDGFADGADDTGGGAGDGHSLDAADGAPVDAVYVDNEGNVGVGTTNPTGMLEVSGTFRVSADTARDAVVFEGSSAAGRLLWDASKNALRAGMAIGSQWDGANVGMESFAAGYNATASDFGSVALGVNTLASGELSFAVGEQTTASGLFSFAAGKYVTAEADSAMVLGTGLSHSNRLVNDVPKSLMVGFNTDLPTLFVGGSYGRVGVHTTSPQSMLHIDAPIDLAASVRFTNGPTGEGPGDGLVVGAYSFGKAQVLNLEYGDLNLGSNGMYRMTIADNGNVGVGTQDPQAALDVRGTFNVGSNNDEGYDVSLYGEEEDSRVYWCSEKMALMAGREPGGAGWAPDSVGMTSFAVGDHPIASGEGSVAIGTSSRASGDNAVAIGQLCLAKESGSIAMGEQALANTGGSIAIGQEVEADGSSSVVIGKSITASGSNSYVIGTGYNSFNHLTNDVDNSLVVGFGTTTPTLFVGGASERVGIGTDNPKRNLQIHREGPSDSWLQFTNGNSGDGANDGLIVGLSLAGTAGFVTNMEPSSTLHLGVAGSSEITIDADGEVGIGTLYPRTKLEVTDVTRITSSGALNWPSTGEGLELAYNNSFDRGFIQVIDRGSGDEGELAIMAENVGIGVLNPEYKLDVRGESRIRLKEDATGDWIAMRTDGGNLDFEFHGGALYVQSDTDGEHILLNPNRNSYVAVGGTVPTATLDVIGDTGYNQLRMRSKFTPGNSSDVRGSTGDIAWDNSYIYIKTDNGWKRASLSLF
jgi:hypothetical protein